MELNNQVKQDLGIVSYNKLKQFKSKKNRVWHIQAVRTDGRLQSLIVKEYQDRTGLEWEAKLLIKLKKEQIHVPTLLGRQKNALVMEYIHGKVLLDHFQLQERKSRHQALLSPRISTLMDELVQWLSAFYRAGRQIAGETLLIKDIHLRNFILTHQIYGIDFEDCQKGCLEEDAGKLCAYVLTYDPMDTPWKRQVVQILCDKLVKTLDLNKEGVQQSLDCELREMEIRRRVVMPVYRIR
jgi:tRNA A-37 threonylcarbamoyl transferase component Bud32